MNYENMLFKMAPWTKEIMQIAKHLNDGEFMRGRSGWIKRRVQNPESIYEHSCKVGLAAGYLFGTKEAIAEGVIHDFPEIFEPDHLPGEIDLEDKQAREFEAMKQLKSILPNGNYWLDAWLNFENKIGIGKYINELDKICPVIQAKNYLKNNDGNNLGDFYTTAKAKVKTPSLIKLLDDLWSDGSLRNESAYQSYFKGLDKIQLI